MSLRAPIVYLIPEETAAVARAAFPRGNAYMRVVEALGPLYSNPQFAALFPVAGQPAVAPAQLALVSVFQFAEGRTDRQAADAVRGRIDWKYALALALTDPGFAASVLCEFRQRLLDHGAEAQLFETLLTLSRTAGLVKARGRQRTDATHVLAAIQTLNRLELVGETLRQALNIVATAAPAWVQGWVPADWFARYGRRFEEYRLPPALDARTALAVQIGADGRDPLAAVLAPAAPTWLRELPAGATLRRVWLQQFVAVAPDAVMRWRSADDLPPARLLIRSPYDPDARLACKRGRAPAGQWTGYEVHLTESCDPDLPHLITEVTTTSAPTADSATLPTIQAQLADRDLLPAEQLVDQGYVTVARLQDSHATHQCTLIGPLATDRSWQAHHATGYDRATFALDWHAAQATCPQGQTSQSWKPRQRHERTVITVRFPTATCRACPARAACVASPTQPRTLHLRPQPLHDAIQAARARQHTPAFRAASAQRAGIEGTIAQAVGLDEGRRTRYRGLAKTRLLHLLLATALNLLRYAAWLAERPLVHTRCSAFARLAPCSA